MKAYSGLYQTYLKMKKLAEAEQVFATLFALGVSNNKLCTKIAGHSSLSGSEKYNEDLSLKRAQQILQLLQLHFPAINKRASAVGKGFKETIVGSGTDDSRDVVDRRVEFVIVNCAQLHLPL